MYLSTSSNERSRGVAKLRYIRESRAEVFAGNVNVRITTTQVYLGDELGWKHVRGQQENKGSVIPEARR